jgi:hypothetical protein
MHPGKHHGLWNGLDEPEAAELRNLCRRSCRRSCRTLLPRVTSVLIGLFILLLFVDEQVEVPRKSAIPPRPPFIPATLIAQPLERFAATAVFAKSPAKSYLSLVCNKRNMPHRQHIDPGSQAIQHHTKLKRLAAAKGVGEELDKSRYVADNDDHDDDNDDDDNDDYDNDDDNDSFSRSCNPCNPCRTALWEADATERPKPHPQHSSLHSLTNPPSIWATLPRILL